VRNVCGGVRPWDEGKPVTDTPIYDQMQCELRAGHSRSEQRGRSETGSHGQDNSRRSVSVWALVDEHRRRS
jgi:hypothetical protein